MVNKKLAEWIKSEESQGYSEQQLRDYLINKKYNKKDVEDAITLAKSHKKFNFKEFIKPTPLKLFFPVLFLILIFVSFFVNSAYAPDLGETVCNMVGSMQEYQDLVSQRKETSRFDADPNEIIQHLESQFTHMQKQVETSKELYTFFKPLLFGNVYFYPTMIYKLNPLFPVACEWNSFESRIPSDLRCSYYINEEDYNCVIDFQNKQEDSGAGFIGMFGEEVPPYNKINFVDVSINALLLGAIIYIIVCLISYLFGILSFKDNKIKLLTVLLLLILPALSLFLGFAYPIFLYPLIILFSILLFIKNNKTQKKILYISTAVLLLLLVGGIFVGNILMDKTLERQATRTYEPPQFKAIYCDNTKVSTAEELNIDPNEVPTGTALKMCYEPSCGQICDNHCKSIGKESYSMTEIGVGNNPFCVCGC